jgi:hypothetical protein
MNFISSFQLGLSLRKEHAKGLPLAVSTHSMTHTSISSSLSSLSPTQFTAGFSLPPVSLNQP